MTNLFAFIEKQLKNHQPVRLVLPEGNNPLIQQVAQELVQFNIEPTLIFTSEAELKAISLPETIKKIVMKKTDLNRFAAQLVTIRRGKVTLKQAHNLIQNRIYFATMLLKNQVVDALVGGISCPTSDIIRPALQIIRPQPEHKLVSSVFLMMNEQQQLIFTDCALNINPTPPQLATIAKLGYCASQLFEFKQAQIAFLSYSTGQSGSGESVNLVQTAVDTLKSQGWHKCQFDGPLQFDAAVNRGVRMKKAPQSPLTDNANIFVFPTLDAGNIGYKIAQRLGNLKAIGPILMGLNQPVNDLSRGATKIDVLKTALLTAYQGLMNRHENSN